MSPNLRALIVGGYGTFGRRIVGLLAGDARLTLIVAGRSRRRAEEWCSAYKDRKAKLLAAAFDRDSDLKAQLAVLGTRYRHRRERAFPGLWRETLSADRGGHIAQGVKLSRPGGCCPTSSRVSQPSILRLAAKGHYVLSGVSSFPVLTAAAARRLATGHDPHRCDPWRHCAVALRRSR